jgi:hypothetical protein
MKIYNLITFLLAAILLTSCGSGNSFNEDNNNLIKVEGIVISGYLKNAQVFLDLNSNGKFDYNEPNSLTNSEGKFNFFSTQEQVDNNSVIAIAVKGQTIDMDYPDVTIDAGFALTSPPGKPKLISPITTLIVSKRNYLNITTLEAEVDLIKDLNMPFINLYSNYLEDQKNNLEYKNLHNLATASLGVMKFFDSNDSAMQKIFYSAKLIDYMIFNDLEKFKKTDYRHISKIISSQRNIIFPPPVGVYDDLEKLINYPGKVAVPCPEQNDKMGVLLSIGQSNSANTGELLFSTKYPNKVFNFFNGKCYVANSPLLGATSESGEFLTPLADELISKGVYNSIVIVTSGIGASEISRWALNGDLNNMLINTIKNVNLKYKISDIIWHQGEKDYQLMNSTNSYINSFYSLQNTLFENNVVAPFFISISTYCSSASFDKSNSIVIAQNLLINKKNIKFGVNTDELLSKSDRRYDSCHFGISGQIKTAMAYAAAIQNK